MKFQETKILFHTLVKRNWATDGQEPIDEPFYLVEQILDFIIKLPKKERFYEFKSNKFCFIDYLDIDGATISGCFKSARNEFRPNLIDRRTGNERRNPKQKTEGDIEKTHFIIKIDKDQDEVFLFLESNFDGISVLNFINYVNVFAKRYSEIKKLGLRFSVKHFVIPRNNFLTELEKLSRTKIAEVYVDKKVLGNEFLKYSNRTMSVQHDIMLQIKAERQQDIKTLVVDLFSKYSSKRNDTISKIRIKGVDEEGNDAVVDTSFMGLIEYISVKIEEDTGSLSSLEFFAELKKIVNFF